MKDLQNSLGVQMWERKHHSPIVTLGAPEVWVTAGQDGKVEGERAVDNLLLTGLVLQHCSPPLTSWIWFASGLVL